MKPTDDRHHGPAHDRHHPLEPLDNPLVGHEEDDVNVRGLLAFAVGLAAVTGIVALLMWVVFIGLESLARDRDPELSPLALPAGQRPPEPRLLLKEPEELRRFREREAEALAGGADPLTGATRMSIEEAMRQVATEGLPARPEAVGPREGTRAPSMGGASGGRTVGSQRQ
jgi:hypothetical protein